MANTIEVKVPDIGDYSDVPVIEVLVAVGDTVKKDQGLVTLESDKATLEVPSSADGVVREIKVKDAQPVKKGDVLVVLTDDSLDAKVASLEAELERLKIQHRASSVLNQAQRLIDEKAIANKTAELNDHYRRRDELTIRAPIDGYVVAKALDDLASK